MAVGTGGSAESEPCSGTGTESVSMMGNKPGPGCVLGAVKITNGRTESNSNKRKVRAGLGNSANENIEMHSRRKGNPKM